MKLTDNSLLPETEMFLTQALDVPIESRIVASMISLADPTSASLWKEIPAEEAEAIRAEQQKLLNAQFDVRKS